MHWHAEVTMSLALLTGPGQWLRLQHMTLRGYAQPGGYAAHAPFLAIAQADVYAETGRAFVRGALRADGGQLTRDDWRALARLLGAEHGVITAVADRHGREVVLDCARWAG